ncbi:hypothetical protein NM688_g6486 [Phlebia brevispora]|uniref:Uncharacterized protein n=1 Tax=Phlebia brevispora TaxID=194682 RepID=A0ACC1SFF4_9APHY|nr:hypothetical protein NM688_g6486 [Phlebia brevispora]
MGSKYSLLLFELILEQIDNVCNHVRQETTSPALCSLLWRDAMNAILDADRSDTDLFSQLAPELLVRILLCLDAISIARCSQVCHRLDDVVKASVKVQYWVECDLNGFDDNPRSKMNVAEKLQSLRTHCDVWRTQQWASDTPLAMLDWWNYDAPIRSGNTMVFRSSPTEFTVHQVSSKHRGLLSQEWVIKETDIGFEVSDYAVDASQDLLVVTECRTLPADPDHCIVAIWALSLSTGKPHPLSSPHRMELQTFRVAVMDRSTACEQSSSTQISHNLDIYRGDDYSKFEPLTSLTFIRDNQIMLTSCPSLDTLAIFTYFYAFLYPSEQTFDNVNRELPFYKRESSRIVDIRYALRHAHSYECGSLRILVPVTVLEQAYVRAASKADHQLEWSEWGTNIRLLPESLRNPRDFDIPEGDRLLPTGCLADHAGSFVCIRLRAGSHTSTGSSKKL